MNRRAMTNAHPRRKSKAALLLGALMLSLSACGQGGNQPDKPPLADARVGGPFTLVDKNGKNVRWSDFDGRYRIVYFGYTYCPDACPTDMAVIGHALDGLEKSHPELTARVVPIFITVDPERDTPQIVGQFAAAFSPRVVGLTGSKAEIDTVAQEFAVYHARGAATPGGGYLIDHSRTVLLMGPKGEPVAILPADKGPDAMAAEIVKWVK